ncbi:MAG TPA: hypothetical protein PLG34_01340 [Spirochaetota bacterium]|jgi:hypothetical protein|nr:MAG: hypothetical protein BWX91_00445 [Spirochaetes bacterium ADurb.Bin133]HNZ28199.1 hypothetical protein [Spirochaetota bacterium]HPY86611.1 hypothetical protein [Spirochaetota bacterium]
MISKRFILIILSLLGAVLLSIIFIVGIYFFNWFGLNKGDNYSINFPNKVIESKVLKDNDLKKIKNEIIDVEKIQKDLSDIKETSEIISTATTIAKTLTKTVNNTDVADKSKIFSKEGTSNINKDGSLVTNGFVFSKNQSFHSYGEYISAEEYKYRLALINNLKLKTVAVDSITKGNGISQEFYKIAYNEKMIPAKPLQDIVESKEFRDLIPKSYLAIEDKISVLKKGESITFKNEDLKNLLLLWSQGKLTPIQKAWKVKADI